MESDKLFAGLIKRLIHVPKKITKCLENLEPLDELPVGDVNLFIDTRKGPIEVYHSFYLGPGLQSLKKYEYDLTMEIVYACTPVEEKLELEKERSLVCRELRARFNKIIATQKGLPEANLPKLAFHLGDGWVMHAFKTTLSLPKQFRSDLPK
jgi:hypothetical protein